jgi:hypothetical protein
MVLDGIARCPERQAARIEVVIVGDDEVVLPDVRVELRNGGRVQKDKSDALGRCRFEGIDRAASVELTLVDVDGEAWKVRAGRRLGSAAAASAAGAGAWTSASSAEPATPAFHDVQPGECLYVLALRYGFTAEALWDHPPNRALWTRFHSKAVIRPGIRIALPERRTRWQAVSAGHLYLVHRTGTVVRLRIRLLQAGRRPVTGCPYVLALTRSNGDQLPHRMGKTDEEGYVRASAPADVRRGTLAVLDRAGRPLHSFALSLGTLRPADDAEGVRARLANLGYAAPEASAPAANRADLGAAPDPATSAALLELHLS